MSSNQVKNLIITGVGGQGNVLAASILASALLARGFEVTVGDVYGLTQRGGSVASHVRWREKEPLPPLVPARSLDILLAFEPLEALRILAYYGKEKTSAIVNEFTIMPIGVQTGRFSYPEREDLFNNIALLTDKLVVINASLIARKLKNLQVLNMVMLGALSKSGLSGLDKKTLTRIIASHVPKKFIDINLQAFTLGFEAGKSFQNR